MSKINDLLGALGVLYEDTAILSRPEVAHVVVDGHDLLSVQQIPGVTIETEAGKDAVEVALSIAPGVVVEMPIHLCVGMLAPYGAQRIRKRVRLGDAARARFIAHCIFPNAQLSRHEMQAEIELGKGAEMRYSEGHYHGFTGGIELLARTRIKLADKARYFADFSLLNGRVGQLELENVVEAGAHSLTELSARVSGRLSDRIRIRDELVLAGEEARGLIKTRVAVQDDACSEVVGITEGQAAGARGHMDCMEIVRDRATAHAEPIVRVSHPQAKITHEAAVGTVDQKQLETLMARGLTPDEAVDLLITGMLEQ